MRIVFFRHGPAGSRDPAKWPDDSERPLTPRGVDKTREAAKGLVRLEPGIRRILTSPLKRASQTAKALEDILSNGVKPETLEALAPGSSARGVIAKLAEGGADDVVVLVGHEPGMGTLAVTLMAGPGVPIELTLKKAGACAVEFGGPVRAGSGELRWLLPAKVLRKLGRKKAKSGKART